MWLLEGFAAALSPLNVGVAFIGCILGTLVGVLPGLGPTSAVALLFPITLLLPPATGLIALGAIYYGAMYGGSTTAILLNIPGEISALQNQTLWDSEMILSDRFCCPSGLNLGAVMGCLQAEAEKRGFADPPNIHSRRDSN